MKEKKIKLINDEKNLTLKQAKESLDKLVEEENKEVKKMGRSTLLTPELFSKLIKLFEKHFFIAIVAAHADIYRGRIDVWQREQETFHSAVMHAQDKWIAKEMAILKRHATQKSTKDWRARKWRLSVAKEEFNDKKYLREAGKVGETQQITIIINQRDLSTSKSESMKVIGESTIKEETISLIPFEAKKSKLSRKEKIEKAESEQ